jgi:hypothetical protein
MVIADIRVDYSHLEANAGGLVPVADNKQIADSKPSRS